MERAPRKRDPGAAQISYSSRPLPEQRDREGQRGRRWSFRGSRGSGGARGRRARVFRL